MPIIDGKVVRARYTKLDLGEISSVDNPAQIGATASIAKRNLDPPSALAISVAKYVGSDDGAHSFDECLAENKFSEIIWPLTDAFLQSIRSIVGDRSLSAAVRETMIAETVDEFLAAVRSKAPAAEAEKIEIELGKLSKGDPDMKTVEQLTAEIAELTKTHSAAIEALTTERDTAKAAATAAETERDALKANAEPTAQELASVKTELATAKTALAAATDETLKVGDREIKKSAVGADTFEVFKAQEQRASQAVLEKRADSEFGHVVGESAAKAAVLGAILALPEETQKAGLAILASAEKMAAGAFARLGMREEESQDVAKAAADFNAEVIKIKARDNCSQTEAMQKARTERPDLFAKMQGEEVEAA